MTPPHEERYERGWERCTRCGTRRPLRTLGTELVEGQRVYVCLDSTWCKRVTEQMRRRSARKPRKRDQTPGDD